MADLRKKPSKEVSDSTDNYKKFEDMTLFEKVRYKAEQAKRQAKKRDAGKALDPKVMEASTDDPKYPFPSGPPSTTGDGATETIKPDSGESFMKRMKRLNQQSPTKLVSKFPNPGTISDDLSDKIKKSKKLPSTPPYAPPKINKGGLGGITGVLGGGLQVMKKLSDLFGK